MRHVAVFAGRFASQPLVFAHLLDTADQAGLALDLDHVEVIQGHAKKRLRHVFAPADATKVDALRGGDDTLILVFAEALIPGARLFTDTPLLRAIGEFTPIRRRSLA